MKISSKKYLGFDDRYLMAIGLSFISLIFPIIFNNIYPFDKEFNYLHEVFEAFTYGVSYWILCRQIMIACRKRIPEFKKSFIRIIWVIILCAILSMVLSMLLIPVVNFLLDEVLRWETSSITGAQGIFINYLIIFVIIGIYESIWFYNGLKNSIQEKEQMKIINLQTQLKSLRNQVNPHFLFNSLNTLKYIVSSKDLDKAIEFIIQLSKVYRYILESREEATISIEEELVFIRGYISIQKERFLDNLTVDIHIPNEYLQKQIIPLSLQLLIENAIKHNIISSKKPLKVSIEIDPTANEIFVKNNLQRKKNILHSTKVGLQNIKERYRLLSENYNVSILQTAESFVVKLPILNN